MVHVPAATWTLNKLLIIYILHLVSFGDYILYTKSYDSMNYHYRTLLILFSLCCIFVCLSFWVSHTWTLWSNWCFVVLDSCKGLPLLNELLFGAQYTIPLFNQKMPLHIQKAICDENCEVLLRCLTKPAAFSFPKL